MVLFLGSFSTRARSLHGASQASQLIVGRLQRSSGSELTGKPAPSVGHHGTARRIEHWQPIKTSNCIKSSPGVVQGEQESGGWARQHHSRPTSRAASGEQP